jgi:hypothetical protein
MELPQPLGADPGPQLGSTPSAARVRAPIDGLYESIDPDQAPPDWSFKGSPPKKNDGVPVLRTDVSGPDNTLGWFERAFNPTTTEFQMRNAFLQNLPKWIQQVKVPLVLGKGTPTQTYVTIYQMRRLGVSFGKLRKVKMSTIQNVEAILQLAALRDKEGLSLEEAIVHTHSVTYGETPLIQSGHKIVGVKVDSGKEWPICELLSHFEGYDKALIPKHNELLKKYDFKRDDKMLWNYNIYLEVQLLAVGVEAPPLSGVVQ